MKTNKDNNYSFAHVLQRYEERYGYSITRSEYDNLCTEVGKMIGNNENIIKKDTNKQYTLKFPYNNRMLMLSYDIESNKITTFLRIKDESKIVIIGLNIPYNLKQKLYELSQKKYVRNVYGLPDLTMTSPVPVGTSVEVYNHIYPSWIGTDIGCGIDLYEIRYV